MPLLMDPRLKQRSLALLKGHLFAEGPLQCQDEVYPLTEQTSTTEQAST